MCEKTVALLHFLQHFYIKQSQITISIWSHVCVHPWNVLLTPFKLCCGFHEEQKNI